MRRKIFISFCSILFLYIQAARSQELNARVTVLFDQIRSTVDRKVFTTLQTGLSDFINKRRWTNDTYQVNEKIVCSFLLNLQAVTDQNTYTATLTIQAARPVYNSTYLSPLMNFQDNDVAFRYVEFQPLEFNENRVQGTQPLVANLTAIIAYYVNIILALDYDSFGPRGGDPYFQKAMNIVNSAPGGNLISGWQSFDGLRNRYWLAENFVNSRYTLIHDAYYTYYRLGMDKLYENENEAREQIVNCLNALNTLNVDNPNIMAMQFFFQGKADEIIKTFKRASPQDRARAIELLQRLDISNAGRYKQELK
jgi:Domain of unknown function (DUF4835)